MTDNIRAKLEALICDSGMFNAGKQEERIRLMQLIDIRIDQLSRLQSYPHNLARQEELKRLRQSFEQC